MRVNRGQEFVIGACTVGTKAFDALIFGYYEGHRLIYAPPAPETDSRRWSANSCSRSSAENHLRHTKFIALRDDKPARDVVRE